MQSIILLTILIWIFKTSIFKTDKNKRITTNRIKVINTHGNNYRKQNIFQFSVIKLNTYLTLK